MKHVGILGGTFDPPHLGHLIIAQTVYEKLSLDEVWFIPSYEPPHKHRAYTTAYDRVTMVEEAIASNPAFKIDTVEVERSGKSFTIDTIKALKHRHPDTTFYFIIGADMVEYLPKWAQVDELMSLVHFVGVKRHGYTLTTNYPVMTVGIPTIEISSTMIREQVKQNRAIKYVVPSAVEKYIRENELYGDR